MKILKKHGKKVSVMLLAIALMISPMLPIVKAADNDTCEKRFHYYFLLAEEAYIDNVKLTSGQGAKDCDTNPSQCTISRHYSNEYKQYFGFTADDYTSGKIWPNTQYTSGTVDYAKKEGGVETLNQPITTQGPEVTGYDSYFFNHSLPDGYTTDGKITMSNDWSDTDWQRYVKMYVKNLKVASGNTSQSDVSEVDGDDYYFIHYSWKNIDNTEWKNSDTTHALSTMFADFDTYNYDLESQEVKNVLAKLKNASYSVSSTAHLDTDKMGKTDVQDINGDIQRQFGTLTGTNKDFFKYSVTASDGSIDTYAWYFFPAMATVKFTASGDVCNAGNDVIDTSESSTKNPGTGIVSYAIIGTLLVGAASAYIYARKNNKFNKV